MNRPLVFRSACALVLPEDYAEDFPYRQTRAVLVTLDELEAWLQQAKTCFGSAPLPLLDRHRQWLAAVEEHLEDIRDALEDDEDEENGALVGCRLSADDPWVESLETLLDNCPDESVIEVQQADAALAATINSLTEFWIEQIARLLRQELSLITGDGEVLSLLKRQAILAQVRV